MSGQVRVTVLAAGFGSRRGYRGAQSGYAFEREARGGRSGYDGRIDVPAFLRIAARFQHVAVAYSARVLLDSVSPDGVRLTTLEVTFPRFVLADFNTHRSFSRNSASSRAVPTAKLIERVERDPAIPLEWGLNKAGMSASDVLSDRGGEADAERWLEARDDRGRPRARLLDLKVHKQELNRLLEPFLWHTVIVTATEWENFFELRGAQRAAGDPRSGAAHARGNRRERPRSVAASGTRRLLQEDEARLDVEIVMEISAARCARVSYLTHEGTREIAKDLELYERLEKRSTPEPIRTRRDAVGRRTFTRTFAAGFRCVARSKPSPPPQPRSTEAQRKPRLPLPGVQPTSGA